MSQILIEFSIEGRGNGISPKIHFLESSDNANTMAHRLALSHGLTPFKMTKSVPHIISRSAGYETGGCIT